MGMHFAVLSNGNMQGGMKAVIWTDVIQMSLMFVALLVVLLKATVDTGGVVEVYRRTDEAGRLNLFE